LTVQKFPKDAGRGCCETRLNKRHSTGRKEMVDPGDAMLFEGLFAE